MTQESHLGDYKSRGGKNFEMNKNTKILNLHVNEKKCIMCECFLISPIHISTQSISSDPRKGDFLSFVMDY